MTVQVWRRRCRLLGAGLVSSLGFVASVWAAGTPLAPPAVYPAGTWQGKGTSVVSVLDRLAALVEVLAVLVGW